MPQHRNFPKEPVAIVGSSCRFAGGISSPSELWDLLRNPHDISSEIPPSRFNVDNFWHPDRMHHGTSNVRQSYTLSEDFRAFDAPFFGISPAEANAIDPQQRLLLETTYEALEAAGIPIEKIQSSDTSVYVGVMSEDYSSLAGGDIENIPTYLASGTARSILSNRISYFFDLHGPSMTIDTACSSSLVALHQAVQSLRSGESHTAIVAGSNLLLTPDQYVAESKLSMLSPSGRSRMWDSKADGYARGDGFVVLILKTLSKALVDHDHVECIIRETGVNQDGRTRGITMPSATAQANLIRTTYARAGLDPRTPSDRPQYFEAHGTGTPAGDPIEAEAISSAFFGNHCTPDHGDGQTPLFVGSIKTVLGHAEGAAGLAGVLKASLALQNKIVPPNLLLDELSPKVKPFCTNLKILSSAIDWPSTTLNGVRRASVNSFGFGGANSHAILESFNADVENIDAACAYTDSAPALNPIIPFNFSSGSSGSLREHLAAISSYLANLPRNKIRDFAWTMNSRRTTLPTRVSISVSSEVDLIAKLNQIVNTLDGVVTVQDKSMQQTENPRLLGIFTGQGAQWTQMGSCLIQSSSIASACLKRLQRSLDTLPLHHIPDWSLMGELTKTADATRINEASVSQPICTAVQVMIVDILKAARVSFTSVVGHSSGEIAAAYATGYISAEDAIRIAYYRGYFLDASMTDSVTDGAMLAAGTSFSDAYELCALPSLRGRICIAAKNSPTSMTLSGDRAAVNDAKEILEDEGKFARILKVDRAYHSHHMVSCLQPYVEALRDLRIKVQTPTQGSAVWVSSVTGEKMDASHSTNLATSYWAENMAGTVLFSDALSYAVGAYGIPSMVVEVGPHPALRAPVLETVHHVVGQSVPYIGTLSRGLDDSISISRCLGSLWATLGSSVVDFSAFDEAVHGVKNAPSNLLKNLPTYPWDHHNTFCHQTRQSKAFLYNDRRPHQLLGKLGPDGTKRHIRYRNFLSAREIPWLAHHQVQGQIVFPAAGYVSVVVEAVALQYDLDNVKLVEVTNFLISHALVFPHDSEVETILSVTIQDSGPDFDVFSFVFHSGAQPDESHRLAQNASGCIRVAYGVPHDSVLPTPRPIRGQWTDLEPGIFYSSCDELGFEYMGDFRGLVDISRRTDEATGCLAVPTHVDPKNTPLIIHPATLDSGIQSLVVGYCHPRDGRLRSIHLPTRVAKISINLQRCRDDTCIGGTRLPFHSIVTSDQPVDFMGDVYIYSSDGTATIIQIEGLQITPLTPPLPDDDVRMFTEPHWGFDTPADSDLQEYQSNHSDEYSMSLDMELLAYHYLKVLNSSVPQSRRDDLAWHHQRFLEYAQHCLSWVEAGTHPWISVGSGDELEKQVELICKQHASSIDVRLIKTIGESLLPMIRGQADILEVMTRDGLLDDFFSHSIGMAPYLQEVARMVKELTHRFPHMNIVEIGAGVGAATESILANIESHFASYTYTDISPAFFDKAQAKFSAYSSKMDFKALDIEDPVSSQGFQTGTFDLAIASLSLHATKELEETMRNVRSLLKPGGYLIILEITDNAPVRFGFIFGTLPGWWRGYDEGRTLSPCISSEAWEETMVKTGFSEIVAMTPHSTIFPFPVSVIACQAVDERLEFLRAPLESTFQPLKTKTLTIIGQVGTTSHLLEILNGHYGEVQIVEAENVKPECLPMTGSVISLIDAESKSAFESQTSAFLSTIQAIYKRSRSILWVTHSAQTGDPFRNLFTGIQRSLALEISHIHAQVLEFATSQDLNHHIIAEKILQLDVYDHWEEQNLAKDLLWSREPQILVRQGKTSILRQRLSVRRNAQYNSKRRRTTRKSPLDSNMRLSIKSEQSRFTIEETSQVPKFGAATIRVTYSLLKAVRITSTTSIFVSIGEDTTTGQAMIAPSTSLDSHVFSLPDWLVPFSGSREEACNALFAIHTELVAWRLTSLVELGHHLVVVEPTTRLAEAISRLAKAKSLHLVVFSTQTGVVGAGSWVNVHPLAPRRIIQASLPTEPFTLVNLGKNDEFFASVTSCISTNCAILDATLIYNDVSASEPGPSELRLVSEQVQAAWYRVINSTMTVTHANVDSQIDLNSITNMETTTSHAETILRWEAFQPIQLPIKPAAQTVSFASDKTYWLVGLTGGLGLSLCQWMVQRGARFLALSSRAPKIDASWLQQMASEGCTMKILSCDITDISSVQKVYGEIQRTMPPVAGLAQGAMVLDDALFHDLDLTRLSSVLKPKVHGSLHLDQVLSGTKLDFFVFFSSIAYAAGNAGQSAYASANGFMASLARNRRSKGLAGSVINIGPIIGNGYIVRELTEAKQMALYNAGFSFMSVQDFLEIFAQGVLASPPESSASVELTTGLRIDETNDFRNWASNPIFQHLITSSSNSTNKDTAARRVASVRAELLEVHRRSQISEILRDGFHTKLRSALQMDLDDQSINLNPEKLGIDSLVAVDLQSWFRKEIGIVIPTLKILNAPTISSLLQSAEELITPDMTPLLQSPSRAPQEMDTTLQFKALDESVSQLPSEPLVSSASATSYDRNDPASSFYVGSQASSNSPVTSEPDISSIIENSDTFSDSNLVIESSVPMSFPQSLFWFLRSFVEDETAFNVTSKAFFKGRLDGSKLGRALKEVGQAHEVLRTRFQADSFTGTPLQKISESTLLHLEHVTGATEADVEEAIRELRNHSFQLEQGDLLRMKLLSISAEAHYLVLSYHHIVMDGIGFQIFFTELEKAYYGQLAFSNSKSPQYSAFTRRQIHDFEQGVWSEEFDYWRRQLTPLPPPLNLLSLVVHKSRPEVSVFRSYTAELRLEKMLDESIQRCCQQMNVTPFHFHLAVFGALLCRYSSDDSTSDLCIGVADGNRKDADSLRTLGLFLNMLPLRLRFESEQPFSELLVQTKAGSDDAFSHSRTPFNLLLEKLQVPRVLSQSPLFQCFFNYRKGIHEAPERFGCQVQGELVSGGQTAYDISIDIADSVGRGSPVILAVNAALYSQHDADILLRSYIRLLQEFSKNPAARIKWPPVHDECEIEEAVNRGRGVEKVSQWTGTIVDRVNNMATLYEDSIALQNGSQQKMTYKQTLYRIGQIVSALESHKTRYSTRVGLLQRPGTDWVCSLLAILSVGAVCVPLEMQLGEGRLALIARDSQLGLILADSETEATAARLIDSHQVLDVSTTLTRYRWAQVHSQARPADPAVITYTSGSTGRPKGIVINHASYVNFVETVPSLWRFKDGQEVVLQQSSYAFDMSLCQIFSCLSYGGTLVIPDEDCRRDPQSICELIISEGVTTTVATPTEYLRWLQSDLDFELRQSSWRCAVSGGESLNQAIYDALRKLKKSGLALVDCYGPAEATFACASCTVSYDMEEKYSRSAFLSLPNQSVRILDQNMRPVPIGLPGRIAIGGAGVAEGYSSQMPEAVGFVRDEYASNHLVALGRTMIHLTDDVGRLDASGRLTLHGRVKGSTQVKIAGIRMDLEDVESTIRDTAAAWIQQVVVSPRRGDGVHTHGYDFLVAFVVMSNNAAMLDETTLLSELPHKLPLPQYMRPSVVLAINSIPTTVSGKVDRAAVNLIPLQNGNAINRNSEETPYHELSNFEKSLLSLWEKVLPQVAAHTHHIGQDSDFFYVGGSSLLLVDLQRRILDQLGIQPSISQLFQNITLRAMARMLHELKSGKSTAVARVEWEQELEPSGDSMELGAVSQFPPLRKPPAIVIMTGATGFLGREVLRQLLDDAKITRVYCIAVRKGHDEDELLSHGKVIVYAGDLRTKNVGLSDSVVKEIFGEADVLLHVGADVSFMKSFESLKIANFSSTKDLAGLCLPRRLPFHFVSSAAIARLTGLDEFGPVSVAPYPPMEDRDDGYIMSKWASEVYLERMHDRFGLPVVLHRPSSITGKGAPQTDLMGNVMRYVQQTGTAPITDLFSGYLDFISVESAAKSIIASVILNPDAAKEGIRYVYQAGEKVVRTRDAVEEMQSSSFSPLRRVPLAEWIEKAINAGMEPLLGEYLKRMAQNPMTLPRLVPG